jgi:hypothetical protein
MRTWLRQRPWIWVVLLIAAFLLLDFIFMTIAVVNRPIQVGATSQLPIPAPHTGEGNQTHLPGPGTAVAFS